jgi:hypothetical protein
VLFGIADRRLLQGGQPSELKIQAADWLLHVIRAIYRVH